jgi:hypothetical protein
VVICYQYVEIMVKLPNDIFETIWRLKRQLANVIENARAAGKLEVVLVLISDLLHDC